MAVGIILGVNVHLPFLNLSPRANVQAFIQSCEGREDRGTKIGVWFRQEMGGIDGVCEEGVYKLLVVGAAECSLEEQVSKNHKEELKKLEVYLEETYCSMLWRITRVDNKRTILGMRVLLKLTQPKLGYWFQQQWIAGCA